MKTLDSSFLSVNNNISNKNKLFDGRFFARKNKTQLCKKKKKKNTQSN